MVTPESEPIPLLPLEARGVYRDSTGEVRKPGFPEKTLNKVTSQHRAESRLPHHGADDVEEDDNGSNYVQALTFQTVLTVSSFVRR